MLKPFDNIPNRAKGKILKTLKAHIITCKENSIVLKDNDEYGIIMSGNVKIVRTNYNGTTNIVEEFYENDIIGANISYTNDNEYQIIAKEESHIILFNYSDLINENQNDKYFNQFIKNIFAILNETLIIRNERIRILTKKTIRNKLLEYFNLTSKKNRSRYIYLPYNFSDLADYLAVDRSAMSREIGYLKEEGIIEVKSKRITLLYK